MSTLILNLFFLMPHQNFPCSNLSSFPRVLLLCVLKENPPSSSLQGPIRYLQMAIRSPLCLLLCRISRPRFQPLLICHVLQVPEYLGGSCWTYLLQVISAFLALESPNWPRYPDAVSQMLKRKEESLSSTCWLPSC